MLFNNVSSKVIEICLKKTMCHNWRLIVWFSVFFSLNFVLFGVTLTDLRGYSSLSALRLLMVVFSAGKSMWASWKQSMHPNLLHYSSGPWDSHIFWGEGHIQLCSRTTFSYVLRGQSILEVFGELYKDIGILTRLHHIPGSALTFGQFLWPSFPNYLRNS